MAQHVCPWYLGYFLINPLRRFFHDPEEILAPYVKTGMRVLEVGPGMGYFSLALARLTGETGRVVAVDMEERMLRRLKKRARRAGLSGTIEPRLCTKASLAVSDLEGTMDFALAFAVVHEVPDQKTLFAEIHRALRPQGLLLVSEPAGHVSGEEFARMLLTARSAGFSARSSPVIARSLSAVLENG